MSGPAPPDWRLPQGVNRALWHYANTPRLAESEDAYFAGHPLFETDVRWLDGWLTEPAPVVDLGCGAGRLALHFAQRGFPVVAVDLSLPMLQEARAKADAQALSVHVLRANLCRLGCLPAGHFGYALEMFSTLGMIRGSLARRRALAEAARLLRPGGRLALHAHNLWLNLRDPQGLQWLAGHLLRAAAGLEPLGDRRMTYRDIPGVEVHLYRWPELRRDLHEAGFRIVEAVAIDEITAQPIPAAWLWPGLRAGGWLVHARRDV